MYATLMLYLELGCDNSHLLGVAGELAERFDANVIGIAAVEPIKLVHRSGNLPGGLVEVSDVEIARMAAAGEEQYRAVLASRARHLEWCCHVSMDAPSAYVTRQALAADLIIIGVGHSHSFFNSPRSVDASDLVMQAGRPVLVVSQSARAPIGKTVAIGWKDTREARRAISDAIPLLKMASRTIVVELVGNAESGAAREQLDSVVHWLQQHGIEADALVSAGASPDAGHLLEVARREGVDLLVCGAYGHSRFHEWALGDITRELLQQADFSALMSH